MDNPKSKWPRYLALVLVAAVLTVSISLVLVEKFAPDQTYIPQSIVQIPSKAVAAILKPMQGAFSWATRSVTGYLQSWKLSKTIEIEYNKLKAENDKLVYESMYVKTLEDENARLERMLDVYDANLKQNPILATVTGKETGNWFQKFTIDKGEKHGIKAYMAVINEKGLVGYVDTVYDTTSEVITIIDSRSGVAGIIESSRDQGSVRGTLGLADEPTCRMYYLPVDYVPRPGDTVVTSGIGMPFPKGIKIGEIRESSRHTEDNKRYVVIEPSVDFQHIEEVLVLVYEAEQEDIPDANDGQINYTPVVLDTPRPYLGYGEEVHNPELGAVTPPPRADRMPTEAGDEEDWDEDTYPDPYETDDPLLPEDDFLPPEDEDPSFDPDDVVPEPTDELATPTPAPTDAPHFGFAMSPEGTQPPADNTDSGTTDDDELTQEENP